MPKPPQAEQKKPVEEKKPVQKKVVTEVKTQKKTEPKSEKARIFDRIEGNADQPSKKVKREERVNEKGEQND